MSGRVRRLVSVGLLMVGLPGLGGCVDSGDMKDIELVSALAADYSADTGEITATVQLLQRDKALEPQYAESYYMLQASETELAGAVSELYKNGARELNFSHTTLLLLGQDAAHLESWLDYAERSPELRPTLYPVIAEGKAADMLAAEELPQAAVYMLDSILEPLGSGDPGYAAVSLQEFVTALHQPGQAPVLPQVKMTEDGVTLDGFVVYEDGRAATRLTGDAALGWLLLERSSYLRGLSFSLGQDVVLSLKRAEVFAVVRRPDEAGDVEICFRLRCRADIPENPQDLADGAVQELAVQRFQQVFAAALADSRQTGMDYLGIGREIYRKLPVEWPKLMQTDYLNNVKCRLEADIELGAGG